MQLERENIPKLSADFCDRVVAASRNVPQRRPISLRVLWERAANILPIRPNWAIAMMAAVFVIGFVAGFETYTIDNVVELMEVVL
ncbi:MAG: hypothetical protein FWE50_00765 [Alphaproteobacteria bacterium]|nr:hypothetical protein [Alphaproteobacteria bacterium]